MVPFVHYGIKKKVSQCLCHSCLQGIASVSPPFQSSRLWLHQPIHMAYMTLRDFWSEISSHGLPCGLLESLLLEPPSQNPDHVWETQATWWGHVRAFCSTVPAEPSLQAIQPHVPDVNEESPRWFQSPASDHASRSVFPSKNSDLPFAPQTISWPLGFVT